MNIRFEKWGVRVHFGITRTTKVTGVNSVLKDGKHFLMWDFDNTPLELVRATLEGVQSEYKLPKIYVLCTGVGGYYHAYCFKRFGVVTARTIIASTDCVDKVFFMMGMMRGYFTLRFSRKRGRDFTQVAVLESEVEEDVEPEEVASFVEYTTKNR